MATIDETTYELYLLRYAEGTLADDERQAVEEYLSTHPEQAEELQLFLDAPRLEVNTEVHYQGAMPRTTRPLWSKTIWRAVAAVLIAAVALQLLFIRHPQQEVRMATLPTPPPTYPIVNTLPETPSDIRQQRPKKATTPLVPPRHADDHSIAPQEAMCLADNAELPPTLSLPTIDTTTDLLIPDDANLVYVDNLLEADTLPMIAQQLVNLTNEARNRWQSTSLGRYLARQLPTEEAQYKSIDNMLAYVPRINRQRFTLHRTENNNK